MDLNFTEEQGMLRATVRKICDEYSNLSVLRDLEDAGCGFSAPFWRKLAESGICGLRVDEKYGGVGLGAVDCAVAYEEMGRSLSPSPHFASSLLSARLMALANPQSKWLKKVASGESIVVPAWQETNAYSSIDRINTIAIYNGDELRLSGQKILLPFANRADALLVIAKLDNKLAALIVPAEKVMDSLRPQANMANEQLFAVDFQDITLSVSESVLATDIRLHWDQVMLEGMLAISAQAVGGALQMLETTVQYAKEREQFGQPIGGFQSIAHYLADAATEIEGVRYLVYQACWAFDNDLLFRKLALMAKLQCTAVFRRTTVTAIQIHGGMGFTLEADPQLYYRRAKSLQLLHWDPTYLEERIADEVFA